MRDWQPPPLTPGELKARLRRVRRIARHLGFSGRVEYRHVATDTGGAQYGLGSTPEQDLLVVFAEAFERDARPEDFSLDAILAHERGHQLVCREDRLRRLLAAHPSSVTEEVLASLAGSLLVGDPDDRQALVLKALAEVIQCDIRPGEAVRLVSELRALLERIL